MTPHFTRSKKNVVHRWQHWFEYHCCDYGRCVYCGVVLTYPYNAETADPTAATKDHIHPRSKGGTTTVWACFGCNCEKQALTLQEWRVVRFMRTGRMWFHYEVERVKTVCTLASVYFNLYAWKFA